MEKQSLIKAGGYHLFVEWSKNQCGYLEVLMSYIGDFRHGSFEVLINGINNMSD